LVRTRFDCETRTGFIRNLEDYETLKWFRVLVRNSKRSRKVPRYPIGFVWHLFFFQCMLLILTIMWTFYYYIVTFYLIFCFKVIEQARQAYLMTNYINNESNNMKKFYQDCEHVLGVKENNLEQYIHACFFLFSMPKKHMNVKHMKLKKKHSINISNCTNHCWLNVY
jgi:hypothetical protein